MQIPYKHLEYTRILEDSSFLGYHAVSLGAQMGPTRQRQKAEIQDDLTFSNSAVRTSDLISENYLTLKLLMSYIYMELLVKPDANVVYIWTYVWQR